MKTQSKPEVITFYSYKGGTGRSLAVANVACLFANVGDTAGSNRRVLAMDWDLEAPGLDRYFDPHFRPQSAADGAIRRTQNGVVDLFTFLRDSFVSDSIDGLVSDSQVRTLLTSVKVEDFVVPTRFNALDIMTAGRSDGDYSQRVRSLDWERLLRTAPDLMPAFLEWLGVAYDVVLIDARTGVTDVSGICSLSLTTVLNWYGVPEG
jgi:Mrp family chromosome partitioning ATPase